MIRIYPDPCTVKAKFSGTEKSTCETMGSYGEFFGFRKESRGKKKDVGLSRWKNEWVFCKGRRRALG